VIFNGDASINDAGYNTILSDGRFRAFTIDFQVNLSMDVDEVVWCFRIAATVSLM